MTYLLEATTHFNHLFRCLRNAALNVKTRMWLMFLIAIVANFA